MRIPLRITALVAGLIVAVAPAAHAATYIVMLNDGAGKHRNFEAAAAKAGGTIRLFIDEIGVAIIDSDNADFRSAMGSARGVQSVARSLPVLRDGDYFEQMSPNSVVNVTGGEDERFYGLQWGLDQVGAPAAWAAGATGAGARVAVLDSGIDHDNVDLAQNINQAMSRSFLPCVFNMNCDGFYEDWRVREVTNGSFFNHGTHVAGTIAAADNGDGGIGVAPDAEIVAVKVCTEFDTFCLDEAILPGIVYAASIGADVINMSLGGVLDRNPSELCKFLRETEPDLPCGDVVSDIQSLINAYRRAFHFAKSQGTTVIVSAGNAGLNGDKGSLAFAFSDFSNVLGISALAPIGLALPAFLGEGPEAPIAGPDTLTNYSNYGRSIIDFGAPGGTFELIDRQLDAGQNPFSTICVAGGFLLPCYLADTVLSNGPGNSFWFASGTSMAAPHAAGVAAVLIGLNGGDMAPERLRTAMKRYADDLGQRGHDPAYGDGRVNIAPAVQ